VASINSCVSVRSANSFGVLRIAPPFGAASTSCWRPSAALGLLRQLADGCEETNRGATVSPSVSWTIVWPPAFGPIASVPTDA
jgi:hypothetical protein